MSLRYATSPDGQPVNLPGSSPFAAYDLAPLMGVHFDLPCEDPWLQQAGSPAHAYLEGAARGWTEYPEWMDFLHLDSPGFDLKRAERDLYLHWWKPWLTPGRVLDVGCGIGRFVAPFLDAGATVVGVDGDLESLRRCAWHAAGRPGKLDLHWSSVQHLPSEDGFDVIIACEVLCYVPDVEPVLARLVDKLRPGGALLISVEGRWGWAACQDAPEDALAEALSDEPVLYKPGDRWVRTYTEDELRALLEGAGLSIEVLAPTHYVTDGPLERCAPEMLRLEPLLAIEEQCRAHPIWRHLNRAWTAAAVKPA